MTPRNKCPVKCDFGSRRWVLIRWFSLPLLQARWGSGEEGVAEANCARDRENKLSPVAATTLFRARERGWRRMLGDETDDLFHVEFSFFFRQQRCCLNASAREYLVTAAARTRYSFISHYQVRATILCLNLPPSPRLYTDRWSLELPRCCRSTCRSPSRNIVINLRGINRLLLCASGEEGVAEKTGVGCSPLLTRYCEVFLSIWQNISYIHVLL